MPDSKPALDLAGLKRSASTFLHELSRRPIPELYGTTDGKAVGTFVEHQFQAFLGANFTHSPGNSASGIDFPEVGADLKVTSVRQPQSSCPFRSASQKIYGLSYHLLVFVYEKADDPEQQAARLNFRNGVFLDRTRTADFQTTAGILEILHRQGNKDDLLAFFEERRLPVEEIEANALADRVIAEPPALGYLTMSNALQWRLQYSRVIQFAAQADRDGVEELL